jgi:hypothetical protein
MWYPVEVNNRMSNIAFLMDEAQMADLDFGLIHQNIFFKKASFQGALFL